MDLEIFEGHTKFQNKAEIRNSNQKKGHVWVPGMYLPTIFFNAT